MSDQGMSDQGMSAGARPEAGTFRSKYVWFIVVGVLLLALGLFALFNLFAATIASVFFIGILMLFAGAARVVHAFQVERKSSLAFWLLSGLLYGVAGALVLANPVLGATIMTLLLAAFLIASGVVMIVVSFSANVREGRWWILLSGLLTAVTGVILAAGWPLSGLWALGLLLAIDLTFQGWALIAFGFVLRNASAVR